MRNPCDSQLIVIISDLHLGGGNADPSDDHVYQERQLVRFLAGLTEGENRKIELFINGDFLDFAQVSPEVYALGSTEYWCSEAESLQKLDTMLAGHKDIFAALRDFQGAGNQITIAPGNHDVDLYWPNVQYQLRSALGASTRFETGEALNTRFDGRLLIGHGHMIDPANRFKHWGDPILEAPDGTKRLEMCPGTLFVVKFVNWLEKDYPFCDNLKPVTSLARLLLREDRRGFRVAAGVLLRFVSTEPSDAVRLGSHGKLSSDIEQNLLLELSLRTDLQEGIARLYGATYSEPVEEWATLSGWIGTRDGMSRFLRDMLVRLSPSAWLPIFELGGPIVLGLEDYKTLALSRLGPKDESASSREYAIARLSKGECEVVVFGHTHQPDEWRGFREKSDGGYFNPGSWTR
ncbi:MAG TPA: metallophosphoesterase, partial [Blastocatellia bacterium]|nr:metallophosphoesterase [Blastocatellia bacterium]